MHPPTEGGLGGPMALYLLSQQLGIALSVAYKLNS